MRHAKAPHADVPRADRGENLLYSVKAPGRAGPHPVPRSSRVLARDACVTRGVRTRREPVRPHDTPHQRPGRPGRPPALRPRSAAASDSVAGRVRLSTALSRAVGIEPGTMTKTLQRMERNGLVQRRRDLRDGRSVTIHLTERSRRLEPALKDAATGINALVTSPLTARRVQTFMRTVDVLISEASRLDAEGT